MEIIKVKNADYSRYEELLFRRDRLRKEARIYHGLYVKEFGDLILALFERQVACIRKKKLIGYYQAALNRGIALDQEETERRLQEEMKNYQKQLDEMLAENKAAKKMEEITEVTALKIRRLYRSLAKKLHPDINPETAKTPELLELWAGVVSAYNSNSLKDMEELEILVNKALEKLGNGCMEIEIPDLSRKIEEAEADIKRIESTDPYQYRYLLENEAAVEEKKTDLRNQEKEFADYEKELDAVMDSLLKSGVKIIWKMK